MNEVTLPVGVQADIDETFCYDTERSYQDRAHEYIERYEITRDWFHGGTAVRSVVMDLCRRSFEAGAQMTCADRREVPQKRSRREAGREYQAVIEGFLESGEDGKCISFDDGYDAHLFANGARGKARAMGVPVCVSKRGSNVYLMREES